MPGDITRRVVTSLGIDASAYKAGAAQVDAANKQMLAGTGQVLVQQREYPKAVSTTTKSLERLEAQVDKAVRAEQAQQRQLDLVNRALQEGTITQQRHAELVRKVEQNYARATAATKQNQVATRSLGESVRGLTGLLAGLGIYLGARQLWQWTKQSLDAAGGLGELAQQAGVSTDALQIYRFAAAQAGVSVQQLDDGLARLTRSIGDAAAGERTLSAAFARIGVAVKNADGTIRSTEAVLADVADRVQALADPAKQAAVVVDLFGKSGQRLVPILAEGSAGLAKYEEAARRLGVVLDAETIAKADKASDYLARLNLVVQSNVQRAFVEAAPAILRVGDLLAQALPAGARVLARALEILANNIDLVLYGLAALLGVKAVGFLVGVAEAAIAAARAFTLTDAAVKRTVVGLGIAALAWVAVETGVIDLSSSLGDFDALAQQVLGSLDDLTDGSGKTKDALVELGKAAGEALDKLARQQLLSEATAKGAEAVRQLNAALEAVDAINGALSGSNRSPASWWGTDDLREQVRLVRNLAGGITVATNDLDKYAQTIARATFQTSALADATAEGQKLAQAAAQDSAKLADEAAARAKKFEEDVRSVASSIADDLTTALFEGGKNGFDDILENVGEWVRRIGLEILKQQIILPITTQIVGAVPSLLGISGSGTAGTVGGSLFNSVTGFANDAFDFLGRTLGFSDPTPAKVLTGAGGRLTGGGVTAVGGPSFFDSIGGLSGILGGAATGYGVGGLVGSLLGATGPGSGIGGALGGALGTLTTSFLGPLGPVLGGALGSLVGSLFSPSPSHGPFGLGTAKASNGRLAYTTTQNLKGGVGDLSPLVNETVAVANQLADLFGAEFTDKASIRIGYVNAENGTKGYVVSGSGRPGTNDAFNQWKNFGENKAAAEVFAIQQAVLGGRFNGLTNGPGLQGLSDQERQYLTKSFSIRKDPQEVLKDAQLIVDLFGDQAEAMSEAAAAIKQVNDAYDAQIERAKELGISEAELVRRREEAIQNLKTGFVEGIQDQILAITDPVAFALKQLDKDFETIRANAEDFGVGLVDVERLYGLKRQQILEQYAQTTVADLQRFLEQITFGDLSGASPGNRLAGSRAAFEAAAAQAQAGDATARGRIQDLGTTFLNESRNYNASSTAYYADLARVQDVVRALLGENLPGYASGVANAPGGWSWVGERGPEAMYVPRGATILPNAISQLLQRGAANDSGTGPLREIAKLQMEGAGHLRALVGLIAGMSERLDRQDTALRRLLNRPQQDRKEAA